MSQRFFVFAIGVIVASLVSWSHEGCSPIDSPCEAGCQESGPPERDSLREPHPTDGPRKPAVNMLEHTQWKVVADDQNPYAKQRSSKHICDLSLGKKIEDGVLEINTNYCNFITLEQKAAVEVRAGEQLHFTMWHLDLYAETKGQAYVILTIDGQTIWETTIPIPYKAEFYEAKWSPKAPIPKDARIVFHLRNHGANTWKIHSLTTGVPF